MRWSVKVATLRGIPVYLHVTVLAIAVLLVVQMGWLGLPAAVLFFGSLLVHELAHALAGRRYGIPTQRIDLLILGGMAVMTRPGATPKEELVIAGAGPAASLALGVAFAVPAALLGASPTLSVGRPVDLLALMAALNVAMGLFNLVPALPMDGGRMFRAGLSPRLGHVKATAVAAWVSRAIGSGFIVWGLLGGNYGLIVVGGLLFWMVAHEERAAPAVEAWRARVERAEPLVSPLDAFELARAGRVRGGAPAPSDVVIDVTGGEVRQTREEYVDGYGRRYVIVTKTL